jgi:aspartate/glutamate racemase
MKFDINETLADMINAMKASIKDDWSVVKKSANNFIQSKKDRLEMLANLRLLGTIDQDFFEKRLEDEKEILISELHSIAIVNKVMAQNAANAAFKVLENIITTALKI